MARSISNPQLVLRPQELMVLLRLSLVREEEDAPGYAALAADLGLAASEAHGAVERAVVAQLATKGPAGRPRVRLEPLRLFVLHGARHSFPATRDLLTRGPPTGQGAAPLNALIRVSATDPVPVWPDKDGTVRGETLYPRPHRRRAATRRWTNCWPCLMPSGRAVHVSVRSLFRSRTSAGRLRHRRCRHEPQRSGLARIPRQPVRARSLRRSESGAPVGPCRQARANCWAASLTGMVMRPSAPLRLGHQPGRCLPLRPGSREVAVCAPERSPQACAPQDRRGRRALGVHQP